MGFIEGGSAVWAQVRDGARCQGRDHRLDVVLQPSTPSLDAGLCQPDAIRTGLARCPGKASRVMPPAMGCGSQGQGQGFGAEAASGHSIRPVESGAGTIQQKLIGLLCHRSTRKTLRVASDDGVASVHCTLGPEVNASKSIAAKIGLVSALPLRPQTPLARVWHGCNNPLFPGTRYRSP